MTAYKMMKILLTYPRNIQTNMFMFSSHLTKNTMEYFNPFMHELQQP